MTDLQPETWLPPLYELGDKLGEGGMGVVYACRYRPSGDEYAVKFLRRNYIGDADYTTRFLREAKALQRFDHPALCQKLAYRHAALRTGVCHRAGRA